MLRKLISAALRREAETHDGVREAPLRPPDLDFPPMRPLEPPTARNDNPLGPLCEAVEADLRAAGYLH